MGLDWTRGNCFLKQSCLMFFLSSLISYFFIIRDKLIETLESPKPQEQGYERDTKTHEFVEALSRSLPRTHSLLLHIDIVEFWLLFFDTITTNRSTVGRQS